MTTAIHPQAHTDLDSPAVQAALDRMDEVASVWRTLSDLTCSAHDLHLVDKDNLSSALDFLCREYQAARNTISDTVRS